MWTCQANEDYWTGRPFPEERRVNADPKYTFRAWQAVMAYLLLDYMFLYQ